MKITIRCLILLFSFIFPFIVNSEPITPKFRLFIEFFSNPYFSLNPDLNSSGFSLNGIINCGIKLNQVTLGAEFNEHYATIFSINNTNTFIGAWNIIKGSLTIQYDPLTWFYIKLGVGGGWLATSFNYKYKGFIRETAGGITFDVIANFKPWTYVDLMILHRIQLFFYPNSDIDPYIYSGFRTNFHPYLEWINLYVDAGVQIWAYRNIYIELANVFFVWSIGLSFDMTMIDSFKSKSKQSNIVIENKDLINDLNKVKDLENAQPGDIIKFNYIRLNSNTVELMPNSIRILDEIVNVLKNKPDISIEMRVHTVNMDNLLSEIEIARIKGELIKFYLVKNMISSDKIKIFGYGNYYDKYNKSVNQEKYTDSVEFKIITPNDLRNEEVLTKLVNAGRNTSIQVPSITFINETAELAPASYEILDKIIIILYQKPLITLSIEGYALDTGNPYRDLQAASKRANTIKIYLIDHGINPDRVKALVSGKIFKAAMIANQAYIEFKVNE